MLNRLFLKLLPILGLTISPLMGPMAIAQSTPSLVALNSVADDFQQAEAAIKNREYEQAEVLLQSIVKRDPKNAKAYLRLGNMIERRSATWRPLAAKQAYQQAIALDPQDPEAYIALGPFLSSDRDNEASKQVKFYRQAIKVARPHAEIYYSLAIELSDRYGNRVITTAQQDEAIAAVRQAIELDPTQGKFYVTSGSSLWERGDRAAADASFQAGMKLNYVLAYQVYSTSLFRQNRLSEMVPIYEQAIRARPNDPNRLELVSSLGEVLEKLKRFKDAAALYRQITVIDPTANVDFIRRSDAFDGHLWRLRGDRDRAVAALRRSITDDPNFAYPHGELGKILQREGKLQEAAAAYRQARSLSKDQSYQDELNQIEGLLKAQSLSSVLEPIRMDRSAAVSPQKDPATAIENVERLISLQRAGAVSYASVSDGINRLAGENDNSTVAAFLIRLLKNEDSGIRSSAAEGLGSMRGSAKLVTPQLVLLLKDDDPRVRSGAASGLGRIGESAQSAVPQLISLLEDPDRFVRCRSAQTLGFIGKPAKSALRPLIRLLQYDDPTVRDCVAFALGKIEPFLEDEGK
jgi:tetratricopeptide (TPR) repeat protein